MEDDAFAEETAGKYERKPAAGDDMRFKKKTAVIIGLFSAVVLLSITVAFFGKNYPLNKTVREISLRLIQIRRLSLTRQMSYKLVFRREHYFIDYFDKDEKTWKEYLKLKYRGGVMSEWDGLELTFTKGHFTDYRLKKREEKILKYIVMNFYRPKSKGKKAIIFYRTGDWKVLK